MAAQYPRRCSVSAFTAEIPAYNEARSSICCGLMIKVLIADDCADNRDILADFLGDEGYEIVLAATAADAIRAAQTELPDIILMDLQMPETSDNSRVNDDAGLNAARVLRTETATAGIPIIALTGFDSRARRTEIEAAGCDGFANKPYEFSQLLSQIQRLARTS